MDKNYEMRLIPNTDVEGKTYWTAIFPNIKNCVGGGDTVEEAIADAKENLEFYLEFLKEEKKSFPVEYKANDYGGKIALRISKVTHKRLFEYADEEGVSINSYINSAIENYLGIKQYEKAIDKKIDELQDVANKSLALQKLNAYFNKELSSQANWEMSKIVLRS